MAHYPFRVNHGAGRHEMIYTAQQFRSNYSSIITSRVRRAILRQQSEELFVNSQGIMIGSGELWYAPRGKASENLGIVAVNLGR